MTEWLARWLLVWQSMEFTYLDSSLTHTCMHKHIQYRAQMQYISKNGEEVPRWVVVEIQPNTESLIYPTLNWLNVTTYCSTTFCLCLRCDWLIWSIHTGHKTVCATWLNIFHHTRLKNLDFVIQIAAHTFVIPLIEI